MLTEPTLIRSLQLHWGYSEFRPNQSAICQAISRGQDVFVIASTGSGKSISYQLPPVAYCDCGVLSFSLVICPLISLMEDQVANLNAIGVPAGFVGGSTSTIAEKNALEGQFTVLYITPEKLISRKDEIQRLCRIRKLICIAIDECHCISEWGYDFRPAYNNLKNIKDWFPCVPLIALTATATASVTADIIRQLRLSNPMVCIGGFNRPNLHYSVVTKDSDSDVVGFIARYYRLFGNSSTNGGAGVPSTLIYTHTRKDAERIASLLQACQSLACVRSAFYHAGMSTSSRSEIYRSFARDEINIIVATIAFGMGINKPDVRLVVHCGMPSSVEDYYQQTGRAGRDGEPSKCVLMYGRNDTTRLHSIKLQGHATNIKDKQIQQRLADMEAYCSRNQAMLPCRRRYLLEYFGDKSLSLSGNSADFPPANAMCCDLCDARLARRDSSTNEKSAECRWMERVQAVHSEMNGSTVDLGGEVLLLLRSVLECGEYYGLATPVAILTGTKDKSILAKVRGHERMKSYGAGSMHPRDWWMALGDHLVDAEGMMNKELTKATGSAMNFSYNKYKVTEKGKAFVNENRMWHPRQSVESVVYVTIPSRQLQRLLVASPGLWNSLNRKSSNSLPLTQSSSSTALSRSHSYSPCNLDVNTGISGRRRGTLIRRSDNMSSVVSRQTPVAATSKIVQPHALSPLPPPKNTSPVYFDDLLARSLETRIRKCRAIISQRIGPDVPPYSVLSTTDMKNLVEFRPVTLADLSMVPGWGAQRVANIGAEVVGCIVMFLKDMSLSVMSNVEALSSALESANASGGDGDDSDCQTKCYLDEIFCVSAGTSSVTVPNNGTKNMMEEVSDDLNYVCSTGGIAVKQEHAPDDLPSLLMIARAGPLACLSAPAAASTTSSASIAVPPPQALPLEKKCVSSDPLTSPPSQISQSSSHMGYSISNSFLRRDPSTSLGNPYSVGAFMSSALSSASPTLADDSVANSGASNSHKSVLLKRKKYSLMSKPPPGTRLKRVHSVPAAQGNKIHSQQHDRSLIPFDLAGVATVYDSNLHNLESSIMQYLNQHSRSSFSDILKGVAGTSDSSVVSSHTSQVREALKILAENFCIYMDGDKYCTL